MIKKLQIADMKKLLYYKNKYGYKIFGMNNKMIGDASGLVGDCTGISGYCTGIFGDIDICNITDDERKFGVNINDLINVKDRGI